MIREGKGNLLEANADALVNTVNTTGVMGKGLALQFKRAFPSMFRSYEQAAKRGEVEIGRMHVYSTGKITSPQFIINFPTKRHWRERSRLADIESGLEDLVRVIQELRLSSIAIPPLGCGNGGLAWTEVWPRIEAALEQLESVEVIVFPPDGPPAAASMVDRTERPRMTLGKAVLIAAIYEYQERVAEVSLIEVQKLMYFLQAGGEELNLRFVKDRYGPYADNLRHVLNRVEGHFLTGFGDATKTVHAAEPITVLPGVIEEAQIALQSFPSSVERIERVLRLVDGFESAYGMELLSTVHWVATFDDAGAANDVEIASRLVAEWSQRKSSMFGRDHVGTAWARLRDEGWLLDAVPS